MGDARRVLDDTGPAGYARIPGKQRRQVDLERGPTGSAASSGQILGGIGNALRLVRIQEYRAVRFQQRVQEVFWPRGKRAAIQTDFNCLVAAAAMGKKKALQRDGIAENNLFATQFRDERIEFGYAVRLGAVDDPNIGNPRDEERGCGESPSHRLVHSSTNLVCGPRDHPIRHIQRGFPRAHLRDVLAGRGLPAAPRAAWRRFSGHAADVVVILEFRNQPAAREYRFQKFGFDPIEIGVSVKAVARRFLLPKADRLRPESHLIDRDGADGAVARADPKNA